MASGRRAQDTSKAQVEKPFEFADGLEKYERQPGETEVAWGAFVVYRDLDPSRRRLTVVADEVQNALNTVKVWSSRFQWRRRVEEWDREQDSLRRAEYRKQIQQDAETRGRDIRAAARTLADPIYALLDRIEFQRAQGEDPYVEMSTAELHALALQSARLIPALVQAQRLEHGMTTENIGGHDGGPLDARVQVQVEQIRSRPMAELIEIMTGRDEG